MSPLTTSVPQIVPKSFLEECRGVWASQEKHSVPLEEYVFNAMNGQCFVQHPRRITHQQVADIVHKYTIKSADSHALNYGYIAEELNQFFLAAHKERHP